MQHATTFPQEEDFSKLYFQQILVFTIAWSKLSRRLRLAHTKTKLFVNAKTWL